MSDSLVVSPAILNPLEAVLQESITMNTFVDLQDHVPTDILEQEPDARLLFNNHMIPALMESGDNQNDNNDDSKNKATKKKKNKKSSAAASVGVVILSASSGLFVSDGMIQNIQQRLFPDLIANYAKEQAEKVDAGVEGSSDSNKQPSKASAASKKKSGRKGKKSSSRASSDQDDNATHGENSTASVVPLAEVVQSILSAYPELAELDPALKESLDALAADGPLPSLMWDKTVGTGEDSNGTDGGAGMCGDGLVCEFCRVALFSEELVSKCQQAIALELKRLQSARMSKASVSRKDAATKVRNVEQAFEDAFVNACYQLQAQVKFLQYVEGCESISDDDKGNKSLVEQLTDDLLQTSCADFTSRVTQYCLFKNEIDLDMFQLGDEPDASDDGNVGIPRYCTSPDLTMRHCPKTYLCLNDDQSSSSNKPKEPLAQLREILPGTLGVTLARQWTMCSGSCYHGGSKAGDDGNEFIKAGDLEKFMAHVEENCL